jgi:hypothetical protein
MLTAESWFFEACTGLPCCGGRGASSVPGRQATCELQVNQRRSGNRQRTALTESGAWGLARGRVPPTVLVFWAYHGYHPAPPTINLKNLTL